RQILQLSEAPFLPDPLVQVFRECFRQPVGERLGHYGIVIVVVALELSTQFFRSKTSTDCECANVIRDRAFPGGDKIGQAMVELVRWFVHLLTQKMKSRAHL